MAKKPRFAALIRVSTERQKEKGESLRKQRTDISATVEQLGGVVVEWYGGAEHGTPGYEKKEVKRLLADAQKKPRPFDYVMVQHADRWSRDNVASSTGLDLLLDSGVQFFYVLSTTYDLFDPTARMALALHAVIGEFNARTQMKKSMEARIHRAERGVPTGGKLPFGRCFDPKTEKWSIDERKQQMVVDVARRYLEGESLAALSTEYGVNHSNLHKILMQKCGTEWAVEFHSERLNIHKTVPITVPRLLEESVIKAIKKKAAANKSFTHGQLKYQYLLGRLIFCEHCGYAMFGQTNHQTHRYYRHAHTYRVRPCNCHKSWVDANTIEENVIRHLVECFGNRKAVERAIEAATPNLDKIKSLNERRERLLKNQAKNERHRERTRRHERNEVITEEQAATEYRELKRSDAEIAAKLRQIDAELDGTQTSTQRKMIASSVAKHFRKRASANKWAAHNIDYADMSWADKRSLVESVFGGTMPDGRRMGVYISWEPSWDSAPSSHVAVDAEKPWRYSLRGHLVEGDGLLPFTSTFLADVNGSTNSALH